MAERKRQRKLAGYICCYFYNFICFISLYALVSSLFVFHFTFLIKKLVAGGPLMAGGPHAMAQLAPWVIWPCPCLPLCQEPSSTSDLVLSGLCGLSPASSPLVFPIPPGFQFMTCLALLLSLILAT